MKWKILVFMVLAAAAIQFVPYGKNHENPAVVAEPGWDSGTTQSLFVRACADCHSHKTTWPWYSNWAPISWLIQHDVADGREHFNVSLWGVQQKNKGNEAASAVREGEMPPWFYIVPHPEAKLSDSEKAALVTGLVATFGDKH